MAVQYEGRIDHTEDSIHALFRTQYNTYCLGRVVLTAVAGVALIAAGLFAALPIWAEGLLLLAGCLLFAGRDLPATLRAENALEARAGRCLRTYAPSVPGIWNCARGMPTKNCVMTVWTVWWRTGSICISFSGPTRW